jgi:hypothetical protein
MIEKIKNNETCEYPDFKCRNTDECKISIIANANNKLFFIDNNEKAIDLFNRIICNGIVTTLCDNLTATITLHLIKNKIQKEIYVGKTINPDTFVQCHSDLIP